MAKKYTKDDWKGVIAGFNECVGTNFTYEDLFVHPDSHIVTSFGDKLCKYLKNAEAELMGECTSMEDIPVLKQIPYINEILQHSEDPLKLDVMDYIKPGKYFVIIVKYLLNYTLYAHNNFEQAREQLEQKIRSAEKAQSVISEIDMLERKKDDLIIKLEKVKEESRNEEKYIAEIRPKYKAAKEAERQQEIRIAELREKIDCRDKELKSVNEEYDRLNGLLIAKEQFLAEAEEYNKMLQAEKALDEEIINLDNKLKEMQEQSKLLRSKSACIKDLDAIYPILDQVRDLIELRVRVAQVRNSVKNIAALKESNLKQLEAIQKKCEEVKNKTNSSSEKHIKFYEEKRMEVENLMVKRNEAVKEAAKLKRENAAIASKINDNLELYAEMEKNAADFYDKIELCYKDLWLQFKNNYVQKCVDFLENIAKK